MATQPLIYLDNHATTRCDDRVVAAMLPYFTELYGNPGSVSHPAGHLALDAVNQSRELIAQLLGADPKEIIFTSGATESNNLAIRGLATRPRRRGNHIVSVATEHKAVLDPLKRLAREGFEVTLLPVSQQPSAEAGIIDLQQLKNVLRDDTLLVSVMLANNEIGVLQPIREIATICHERGIPLHCDATQAVGKIPVDLRQLDVDLLSFSGHKMHGPKGIGALYIKRSEGRLRLSSLVDGGGQEQGLRSGTLNVPGIVGLAAALTLCVQELPAEMIRLATLRAQLFALLQHEVPDLLLSGPALPDDPAQPLAGKVGRLPGNLNVAFPHVDGEALMMSMGHIAVSSGSACTSASPEPSHVLRAVGLSEDLTRASLRFGLGRFTTENEIALAAQAVGQNVRKLRSLRDA
ncbi:aminotransferase class V [Pirellula staleyi DSM 6068]|uniref:cysteine desulfurase n=1 Tax=Pirellula staleyi (strain ATCC 27377 / DSM 6068 / ICPB 4128) TaxID=530564 RepID=D2R983_PIRSD|nr:cysteine desulfurase family protein [Pirellula staleyi]ADB17633.1 aminotransferase class V [Pirellula staleyi DSM 6068]